MAPVPKPAKPSVTISPAERKTLEAARRASTSQLLLKAARLLDEVAVARVKAEARTRGLKLPALRPAHTKLFPHIDFAGTRLVTIAERLGVTKQAVSQWIGELEEMRVIGLMPDPQDARAKLVRFTPRGLDAIHHGLGVLAGVEADLAKRVGPNTMDALARALREVTPVLEALSAGLPAT
jgi:DNA-binding MarR family transcriptional regulator